MDSNGPRGAIRDNKVSENAIQNNNIALVKNFFLTFEPRRESVDAFSSLVVTPKLSLLSLIRQQLPSPNAKHRVLRDGRC